jgi:NAD(P)-dependent dehydrogenase (short-subunit alcohol dehydrogenase family)
MSRGIEGRVVAITGGGSGMGRAMAIDLGSRGAKIAICGRRPEPLAETVELVKAAGGECASFQCDVRDPEQIDAFFVGATAAFGAPDTLVNNAAGNFVANAIDMSPNGWKAVIDIVLNGTFYCSRAFALGFPNAAKDTGSILNIIATYAWTGNPSTAHSAAAKAGVWNLTKTLAVEWAPLGIRVNALAPGPTETEAASANLFPTEEIRAAMTAGIPLQRFATLEDITDSARFLLSDEGGYITGETLVLDGGESLSKGMFVSAPPTPKS